MPFRTCFCGAASLYGRCLLITKKIMILCDEEEEYAYLLTEYLKRQKNFPLEIKTYTQAKMLMTEEAEISILLIAESAYFEELGDRWKGRIVILNESGVMKWENVTYLDKYTCAETVYRRLLECYQELEEVSFPRITAKRNLRVIGIYSPIKRSMQTSFALTLGQLLAENHRTLYLNFEPYAGLGTMLANMETQDLSDLLFFLGDGEEKFRLRMDSMVRRIGYLDYIAPMKVGQNLLYITLKEWQELFRKITNLCEYEFLLLDLSEGMQGLYELLRMCEMVLTTIKRDSFAEKKLMQYEQVLQLSEYEDVLKKTRQLDFSNVHKLPEEPERLTRTELSAIAKEIIALLEEGEKTQTAWR